MLINDTTDLSVEEIGILVDRVDSDDFRIIKSRVSNVTTERGLINVLDATVVARNCGRLTNS